MQEPGIRPLDAASSREAVGEGSADLEKLLQTAEAENLQLVKLIETERQKHEAFQKQIEETVMQTDELEESTKNLDTKAKELHNKFKQNREISEGLKKTATVLDEHEEALRSKLSLISLEQQSQASEHNKVVGKYEKMWERFFQKYESIPLAKELSHIKHTAIDSERFVKETTEKITTIQSQIIEIEVEKTHMQEYLQENNETANDCIIKIAKLFVEAETKAGTVRDKLKELKDVQVKLTSAREQAQKSTERMEKEMTPGEENENELDTVQDKGPDKVMEVEETQCADQPELIKVPSHGNRLVTTTQQMNENGSTPNITSRDHQINRATNQLLDYDQVSSDQQNSDEMNKERRESEPQIGETRGKTLPLISTPLRSIPSNPKDSECTPKEPSDLEKSTKAIPMHISSSVSHTPVHQTENAVAVNQCESRALGQTNQSQSCTPIAQSQSNMVVSQSGSRTPVRDPKSRATVSQSGSNTPDNQTQLCTAVSQSGSRTPVNQSESCTTAGPSGTEPQPPNRSPLDLSQHMRFIKSVSKSPGEGFMYRGRSMYNQVSGSSDPGEENNEQNEPEIIYEAPLNDQHDISLNFFQPFNQQNSTNENGLQKNVEPSVESNRSIFMQSSPSKPDASSNQAFSFGPGTKSPAETSSAGAIFGNSSSNNNDQSNNEIFSSGFSFFGAGDSPVKTSESSSGFSFSFGGEKSPSKSSGNSGFCLF